MINSPDSYFVTAFFDIKRDQWNNLSIKNNQYFENFCCWAIIKKHIIVFVENEALKNRILAFRKKLGLEEKTTIIIVDDYKKCLPELYYEISNATNNVIQQNLRYKTTNPEVWNPDYNYVMMMKFWCIKQAAKMFATKGTHFIWIDFGFAHGEKEKIALAETNGEWENKYSTDKITLFSIQKMDDRPIFDVILTLDTYIKGELFIIPSMMVDLFCDKVLECAMFSSLFGLSDDDQSMMLLVSRLLKDNVAIIDSKWGMSLRDSNKLITDANHLFVKKDNLFKRILKWFKKISDDRKYIKRVYKNVRSNELH